MRTIFFICTFLSVIALAFWAYRENYATQAALDEADTLHENIQNAHARLAVLRAEWAFLNRPDRLQDLAEINFERLGLIPMTPEHFGRVDQVAYPARPLPPILNAVAVSALDAGADPL
ncbi:MAG: cell division protein FtsL [Pseudomonadota bacterium]